MLVALLTGCPLLSADYDEEIRKEQRERKAGQVSLTDFSAGEFDKELYGQDRGEVVHELRDEDEDDGAEGAGGTHPGTKWGSLPQRLKAAMAQEGGGSADDVDLSE